ncbi:tripartite tricarboxylate transporter permease [Neotabrizicola sp. VNH66]|uniref:tripartite tricarboxylate transporter permease n=1 Tax=Neotabrizicola sp. VNH66 TaxID=3400918 RepID=UPI003C0BFA2A
MDLLTNLAIGFEAALSPWNLFYCFVGALFGTLIGVLPGLGPVATISMLLPLTFGLDPTAALIMLAGIFYGAQYGGSTTAILINLPGESSSVVTALDGHQLARQGKAGVALATAALASFLAGTIATVVIALFAPPLAKIAVGFTAVEYFSLMILGLLASILLANGSVLMAIGMALTGLLLGLVGADVNSGVQRFTFGELNLADGLDFVVVAMGLFAVAEVVRNLESPEDREVMVAKVKGLMPSRRELRQMLPPALRGTALGSILGILPGGGAILASFGSYVLEKRLSRHPETFGAGAIEGVAGPEAANNAGAQTSFIPMLTLGIPSNPVMALMIGAMVIQGIQPGPSVMVEQPALFWGIIVSMWVGNLFLVLLNLPLIGIWVSMLRVPYRHIFPVIVFFSAVGVFSIGNSVFDIWMLAAFGLIGYGLIKLGGEPAPLLLGFILGEMVEEYFRRAMLISRGDATVFLTRPLSAAFLLMALILVLMIALPALRRKREDAFEE